jgi:hypothetical protein
MEEVEDVLHHGLDLTEDRDRGYEEMCHRTGSWPPWLHGLQRRRRQPASAEPLMSPCLRTAWIAYSEHDGSYLHVVGKSAPNVIR